MFAVNSCLFPSTLIPLSTVVTQSAGRRPASHRPSRGNARPRPNVKRDAGKEFSPSEIQTIRKTSEQLGVKNEQNISDILKITSTRNLALDNFSNFNLNKLLDTPENKVLGNKWHISHISSNSFDINKNLDTTTVQEIPSSLYAFPSSNSLLSQSRLLNGVSFRGFKTKRSYDKESVESPNMTTWLKESFQNKPRSATKESESSEKLKALLANESSPEVKKGIKIAFAEGYLAANKRRPDSKLINWLIITLVLIGGVTFYVFRMMHPLNVSEVHPEEVTVTFEDVRGVEEAKQELQEVVEFLKNPSKFTSLGAELPKGVLLVGPPGTGKTLLARAVAGEAGVPFFHAAGPEFDEILVGQGARRVRDLFKAAQMRAPCVIFIDEIDSVGAKRTNSVLHPYANQTINQLLSEMDGFHKNEGVIVLGATNRRDDLDKALLRPGRFDVEIQVPNPDLAGRREILDYYLGKVKTGPDVDSNVLARGTTGFTGADIKNVVNQAALRAAIDQVDVVSLKHLESARDKILMGPEKKSRIPDEESNWITAYHEGGHTLVSYYTKDALPIHKVTIIPRGSSLGHTAYIPSKEQYHMTRSQMLASMDSLMGGRAAEEIIYGNDKITSGASSDLKQATSIASHMVKDLGMSDKVGLRTFDERSDALIATDSLAVSTKEVIDGEIKKLLHDSYERAKSILKEHTKEHKALAEALMRYETLDADDIKAILDGRSVAKDL